MKNSLEGHYGGMTKKEEKELDSILGGFITWLREKADPDDLNKIEEESLTIITNSVNDRDRNANLKKLAAKHSAEYGELDIQAPMQKHKRLTYRLRDKLGELYLANLKKALIKNK